MTSVPFNRISDLIQLSMNVGGVFVNILHQSKLVDATLRYNQINEKKEVNPDGEIQGWD